MKRIGVLLVICLWVMTSATAEKSKFEERKALAMLYKLEKQTVELVLISRQISELSQKFKELWLQKSASADHSQEQ